MQTVMIVEDDPDIRDGVRIALDCNRVWVDEQEADLTETEYKILKLMMQSPQRIFGAGHLQDRVGRAVFLRLQRHHHGAYPQSADGRAAALR